MAKARILAVLIISLLIFAAFSPGHVLAGTVDQPSNISPAPSTDNISLTPTLQSSDFSGSDSLLYSQWQISTVSGDYASPALVFDSGWDKNNLLTIDIPAWTLSPNTTYYWHVRYQDSQGASSDWSDETSFTTIAYGTPSRPTNMSPVDGAKDISLTPTVYFSSPCAVNVPYPGAPVVSWTAVRVQIATRADIDNATGDFVSSVGDRISDITTHTIDITLAYGTTYYWHVKYQDVYGNWSDWSSETSFTTIANLPPDQPSNTTPVDGASEVALKPTLMASAFSDLNDGDTQAAARWQVTAVKGSYASPDLVFDSDNVTTNLTSISVPAGDLGSGKTYYWHVQYEDNHNNWSGWSGETSFTTRALSVPAAAFGASATDVVAGQDVVTFTDNSTGDIDSWTWDFGDNTTVSWSAATRPAGGTVSHTYTDGGTYTVSLTVTNAAGSDVETKTGYITVHAAPKAVFSSLAKDQVVQFSDSSTGEITSWEWDFGDGTVQDWDASARDAASGKISHAYDKSGTYVVSLKVTGALGTGTLDKSVEVSGGGGFHFGWWMVGVIVAVVLVIGGGVFLVMRRGK